MNKSGMPLVGVYDPGGEFSGIDARIDIDHIFVALADPEADVLIRDAYTYANARNRKLMITIEPWPANTSDNPELLANIRAGAYDQEIDALCGAMDTLNAPLLVRWGHEMETVTGRYPWASGDPAGYVGAYRHFVDRCRGPASQMQFVWSPRGDAALTAYFPGRTYVDYVGLSIYDCTTCGFTPKGGHYSVASIVQEKYRRVLQFDLPVIVAEMGVDGTPERQRAELSELRRMLPTLPMLKAVVYFNAPDVPGAWPWPLRPDWRITPPLLDLITAKNLY